MNVSIYQSVTSTECAEIELSGALARIKNGRSREAVEALRAETNEDKRDELKKKLPCVTFSGTFNGRHTDDTLKQHSGLITLDFDKLDHPNEFKEELKSNPYIFACWISPSGNGVKALVKIADPIKHKAHFDALREEIAGIDPSGRNPSRLCFESYDPEIYVNANSEVFTKTVEVKNTYTRNVSTDDSEIFSKLLTWVNKTVRFQKGERNNFIYKLACSCCRFGILEETAINLIAGYVAVDSSFSLKELKQTVRSAYRASANSWNSAEFDNEKLVSKTTRAEVEIVMSKEEIEEINRQNVVYMEDVEEDVLELYRKGHEKIEGIGVWQIDEIFKRKEGELTVITGYGNTGKSTFWMWYNMMRALVFGEKIALFTPESDPPSDFYFDLMEMFFGMDCSPSNPMRPDEKRFAAAMRWVGKHFFEVSPKELNPTPEVIKETFLHLVLDKSVKTVIIDPFNQLANDYGSSGGRSDKYLETFLSDCSRFAKQNRVHFDIIAHPKTPTAHDKTGAGDYPAPDQFKIADGTMWNNKADNILVYHRPFFISNPMDKGCDLSSKKIRRRRVGKKKTVNFEYDYTKRRYIFDGLDPMDRLVRRLMDGEESVSQPTMRPNTSFLSSQDIKEYDNPYDNDPLNGEAPF